MSYLLWTQILFGYFPGSCFFQIVDISLFFWNELFIIGSNHVHLLDCTNKETVLIDWEDNIQEEEVDDDDETDNFCEESQEVNNDIGDSLVKLVLHTIATEEQVLLEKQSCIEMLILL